MANENVFSSSVFIRKNFFSQPFYFLLAAVTITIAKKKRKIKRRFNRYQYDNKYTTYKNFCNTYTYIIAMFVFQNLRPIICAKKKSILFITLQFLLKKKTIKIYRDAFYTPFIIYPFAFRAEMTFFGLSFKTKKIIFLSLWPYTIMSFYYFSTFVIRSFFHYINA